MNEQNTALIDAIETLTSIADLDLEAEDGIVEKDKLLVDGNKLHYRTFNWQGPGDGTKPDELIKKTFSTILKFLREYCEQDRGDSSSIERIKSIMVLVGESARKLDHCTNLFHDTKEKRVTGIKEYQKLQEFYLTRIARRVDTNTIGQWILGITQGAFPKITVKHPEKEIEAKHIFVDLDLVKRDLEYELFFMHKKDGSRFYNPRLIKNMKLVCDFGDTLKQVREAQEDFLVDLDLWYDRSMQANAKTMIHHLEKQMEQFFHEAQAFRDRELVTHLYKALMALILSSKEHHLLENEPVKCCSEYFLDFQEFLIMALQSRDYQKMCAYPPRKNETFSCHLRDMCQAICYAFFMSMEGYSTMKPEIEKLIQEGKEKLKLPKGDNSLHSFLKEGYLALSEMVKRHPYGPLTKVLETLEEGEWHAFDPLHQENVPYLLNSSEAVALLHLPTPTRQEVVDKVTINEEFKNFMYALSRRAGQCKFLMINLQDRTSWKEHARCTALEDLQYHADFVNNLCVVTLSKDSDFYTQVNSYARDNHAKEFMERFLKELQDEEKGFYFPEEIKDQIFPEFAEKAMHEIHQHYFSGRNVLNKEQRLVFIELFYLRLQDKLLEIVKPVAFSFTCKDGFDAGDAAGVQWLAFHALKNKKEREHLLLCLLAPALLVRGRVPFQERFDRMLNTIKVLESESRHHS